PFPHLHRPHQFLSLSLHAHSFHISLLCHPLHSFLLLTSITFATAPTLSLPISVLFFLTIAFAITLTRLCSPFVSHCPFLFATISTPSPCHRSYALLLFHLTLDLFPPFSFSFLSPFAHSTTLTFFTTLTLFTTLTFFPSFSFH
ncbi:hypothetical protein EDD21DRAFT_449537, partial [Dissophora ornata]